MDVWMFGQVVPCAPEAEGGITRAPTCCLHVLLTSSGGFGRVSLSAVRKTNRKLVPSLQGRSTPGNIINKFKAWLSLKDTHESRPRAKYDVCAATSITLQKIYGSEQLPECMVSPTLCSFCTMRLCWSSQTRQLLRTTESGLGLLFRISVTLLRSNTCSHREKLVFLFQI